MYLVFQVVYHPNEIAFIVVLLSRNYIFCKTNNKFLVYINVTYCTVYYPDQQKHNIFGLDNKKPIITLSLLYNGSSAEHPKILNGEVTALYC